VVQAKTTVKIQKRKKHFDKESFFQKLGIWSFSLIISLIPIFVIFLLIRGPRDGLTFLNFFYDNALIFICVTMSAFSIYYMYGKKGFIAQLHIIAMLFYMAIYIVFAIDFTVPFDAVYDRRFFIAFIFLISIGLSLFTIFYVSFEKEKEGEEK